MFPAFWRLPNTTTARACSARPFEGKVLAVALAVPVIELDAFDCCDNRAA